jgi:hypothetical protein
MACRPAILSNHSHPMKITLKRRAVASLDLAADDCLRLTTRDGTAWVTLEGSANDFVLTCSDPLEFTGPGRLVIEALEGDVVVHAEPSSRPRNTLMQLLETA